MTGRVRTRRPAVSRFDLLFEEWRDCNAGGPRGHGLKAAPYRGAEMVGSGLPRSRTLRRTASADLPAGSGRRTDRRVVLLDRAEVPDEHFLPRLLAPLHGSSRIRVVTVGRGVVVVRDD